MPGKNFVVPTTPQETAAVADAAVDELARRIARQVAEDFFRSSPLDDAAHALTRLHVLTHLQRAAERLQREAAVEAAHAG
ncbi:response regulator, partial [Streptomyces sp. NPDC059759]